MWRLLLLLAFLMSAAAPLPRVTAEPEGAGSVLRIRNTHSQPLTAFVVEIADYPGSHFALQWDEGEIAAGAERRIAVGSMMPGTVPDYLKVTAAVYKDGSTAGDHEKILSTRRAVLRTTREAIRRIEAKAGLKTWSESLAGPARATAQRILRQLADKPLDEVLKSLRESERTLAASKPAL